LLTIVLGDEYVENLKKSLPELPNAKQIRYVKDFAISQTDANMIVENIEKAELFEKSLELKQCSPKIICNWILGDVSKYLNENSKLISETNITAQNFVELLHLIEDGKISNATGKSVFEEMLSTNKTPSQIIDEKGLIQISDESELEKVVQSIIDNNTKSIEDYNNGKTNALGFLVGQCMKATKGQGNPAKMKEILIKLIG